MAAPWRTSLVIGNPENRRINMWQAAVTDSGRPASQMVSYQSLLEGDIDLPALLSGVDVVRLESPGENAEVERLLILRGARSAGREDVHSAAVASALADRGRIVHPHLWALGYRDLLSELVDVRDRSYRQRDDVLWLNDPGDVAQLFDKPTCQQQLASAGIPIPRPLTPVEGYDQLREVMRGAGCRRVFVKLPGGSSASGVVALSTSPRRISAVTSVEVCETPQEMRLYNSLRVQRYEDEPTIARLIDALAADGPLHVEEWVPKAGFGGTTFDLRVVVIAGDPQHVVMRTSGGPLTNLHLGNRRGDLDALRAVVPPPEWEAAMTSCKEVATLFPGCLSLGVDLAFTPGFRRHVVIEVNAFGDLLPGVFCNGRNTYEAQVTAPV